MPGCAPSPRRCVLATRLPKGGRYLLTYLPSSRYNDSRARRRRGPSRASLPPLCVVSLEGSSGAARSYGLEPPPRGFRRVALAFALRRNARLNERAYTSVRAKKPTPQHGPGHKRDAPWNERRRRRVSGGYGRASTEVRVGRVGRPAGGGAVAHAPGSAAP